MLKKNFKNSSIKNKLLAYFISIAVISITAAGLIINIVFSNTLEKTSLKTSQVTLSQVNASIDSSIMNYENILDIIEQNSLAIRYLRENSVQAKNEEWGLLEANIKSLLGDFQQKYYGIDGIAIIGTDGSFLSNELSPVQKDSFFDESWYTHSIEHPDQLNIINDMFARKIKRDENISTNDYFTIIKAIKDPATERASGVILIDLNKELLENLADSIQLGESGFVFILDSEGEVIYSPNSEVTCRVRPNWFGQDRVFIKYIDGLKYQFIFTSSFYTEWKIIAALPMNETTADVAKLRLILLLVLIGICALAIPASILLSSNFAKPIKKLQNLMEQAEKGVLDVRFEVDSQDEIGQLGSSFNKMIKEIKMLMNTIYAEQRGKRKAELRILQSQIRPHFLYNTLDTIHWMSKKYEANDIIKIINALTKLFRLALNNGKEMISLKEELEHVGSYLTIQKERYFDVIDFEMIDNEKADDLMVQKLILQPLVENSIYHGLKEKKEKGKITISTEINDDVLMLSVEDNGAGIEMNKLKELNEMLNNKIDRFEGYGIFNVNDRIKLSFGDEFGVTLFSEYGLWTKAVIRHPIIIKGEEDA